MVNHSNYWFTTCPTEQNVTTGLVRNVDVLIIGGGIAGTTLLSHLVHGGLSNVYLVEEDSVGFHASGRGSGQLMLRGNKLFSKMPQKDGEAYLRFIHNNNTAFVKGLRNVRFDTDLRESGGLRLAVSEQELDDLEQESKMIREVIGIDCPMLTRDDVSVLLPDNCFLGGMFVPTEAMFNPYKIVNGLRELVEKRGSRVITGCQVTSVQKTESGFAVSIRHRGTIKAKKVVYCTNAYTPELIPELSSVMKSFRGQMIATDIIDASILQYIPYMSISCNDCSEYFRFHGQRFLVGGMRKTVRGNQVGIIDDGEISPAIYDRLRSFLVDTMPSLRDTKIANTWSGIMCETLDGLPLIGKLPNREGEYIFAGFNGYGFSHTIGGSTIVRDVILNGESSDINARLFDPARFNHV